MINKDFFKLVGLVSGLVVAQPLYAASDPIISGLPDLIDRKFGLADLIGDNARCNLDFSVRGIYTDVDQEWAGEAFFGIDVLKTFTSAGGDWGSLNVQLYLTQLMDQPNRGSFFEDDHDLKLVTRITNFNYTGLADGKLNFKVGHFEIPYGLEVPINTNGTLRQLNTGSNLGVKADWGVGVNGVLPEFQYELTYTKATGQDIKLNVDTYIVAGRVGTPTDGESFSGVPALGLSFFDSITDGMISAENSLPRRRERGWTAEINTLIHRTRYYRLLLRRNRGLQTHDSIMRKVQELAGVTWDGQDEFEIKRRLRLTWKSLDEHQRNVTAKREKFLQQLANDTNCSDQEKAIKLIKSREASKRQFRRIHITLGRLKSMGLAGVDIPIVADDREITGWRSLTEPEELNKVVTRRN